MRSPGPESQTMLRLEAGGGGRALHRVQPVHGGICIRQLAPAGVVGRQAKKSRMGDAGKKIRIEGDDDVRILQAILRVVVVAECRLRGRIGRVAVDGVPLHPLGVGIVLLRGLPLRCQGGRGDGVAQDVESGASAWPSCPTAWRGTRPEKRQTRELHRDRSPSASGPDRKDRAANPGSRDPKCRG